MNWKETNFLDWHVASPKVPIRKTIRFDNKYERLNYGHKKLNFFQSSSEFVYEPSGTKTLTISVQLRLLYKNTYWPRLGTHPGSQNTQM